MRKIKKVLDIKQALRKAQNYCAYQDRSIYEVNNKLISWGMDTDNIVEIIAQLEEQGFLNELRFALVFAHGKHKLKKWGRIKIDRALIEKNISKELRQKALDELDQDEYIDVLKHILRRKKVLLMKKKVIEINSRLSGYAIGKGFERELVWKIIKEEM